ncbi:hypothetical protein EJ02DRAFT_75305 [Clathrospora elynae]|uniref:Something about silencing protein 4 domain-containing protein n=1 Tax=Clathrospora elynae TaxID=706981 RepID=A0A6A5S9M8_9PLEO|nr:hypothetical protein EJ02DRAFT_75305 [Clathrospora elynae]
MISSLLTIMANAVRPPLRSSNERQTRLNFVPVAADDALAHGRNAPITTRQTSKSGPLLVLADDEKSVKQINHMPARPASPARTVSRKRPATLEPDATDVRRPTKIIVTQSHGALLRIANDIAAPLGIAADRVLPAPASNASSQDKRSLRSHDGGSRLKSDLAIYFCNYDDIIAGVPKPAECLDVDTPMYIVDEPLKARTPAPATPESSRTSASPARSRKPKAASPPSSTTFHVLNYATIANAIRYDAGDDPLADSVFFAQHRRAERKEKQLRNIEKERAMHEKVQLERLLDGLQGPDWLKVMGITGVTDGDRRDWEAKRDYFVREVEALVDKFRVWKEEEKRLRAEKEAALAARDEDSEDDDDGGEETEESDTIIASARDPPPPARQHPKEPEPPKPRRPPRPHGFLLPFALPEPAAPFQSFYAKPHLRAAALGKHRHGRNASAFGLPVPEFEDREFELPEGFVDEQFLRDNARERRRRKRESATGVV